MGSAKAEKASPMAAAAATSKQVLDELALVLAADIEMEMDEPDFKVVLEQLLAALLGGNRKLLGVDKAINKEDMEYLTHKLTELLHEKLD
jgi:hypothetical protein